MLYRDAVVIFVDILGTRNNTEFEDKFLIHRMFHEEVRQNEKRKHDHVVYDRKVFSFSDCAYFIYYYKEGIEEKRKDKMQLLRVAMTNTSISMLRIMNAGYLVRGGIAYGEVYFDDLGFFGEAIETAYELESKFADIPIIMLEPTLGEEFSKWELKNNTSEVINYLYSDRVWVVEQHNEKYFMNLFYQLEAGAPRLQLEGDCIEMESLKKVIMGKILEDKQKYGRIQNKRKEIVKSSIYDKLDWFEKYTMGKKNKLLPEFAVGAVSCIINGD